MHQVDPGDEGEVDGAELALESLQLEQLGGEVKHGVAPMGHLERVMQEYLERDGKLS